MTEKEQLYTEAIRAFKENQTKRAFTMLDGLGGYKDCYTLLGFIALKDHDRGVTLDFVANCYAMGRKKGDAKAFMLSSMMSDIAQDAIKAKRYALMSVDGLEKQHADGDFFSSYLLAQHYLDKGNEAKAFNYALKSAESGYCAAEFLVAKMYTEGKGTMPDEAKAVAYLEKSAYKNYDEAQYELGFRYSQGKGVPQDDDMALKLYQMAAESGISGAAYNLALWYERAHDYVNAFKSLERAALLGNVSAMLKMAMRYDSDEERDSEAACMWYEEAADKGSNEACFLLGEHYESGEGVERNMKQAVEYFEKAAKNGYAAAQSKLGYIYKTNEEFLNPERSLYWNSKAASGGDMQALCNLGLSYEFGVGVDKNANKAFELYKQSALLGYDRGMYNLAYCYMRGSGTAEDHVAAAKYFEKAALKGHVNAMYNVAIMYLNGDGVNKDCKKATEWFYRAAQNNNIESIFYLGYCYMNGLGVSKNPVMAVRYFAKAADGGDAEAMFNLAYCYYNGSGVEQDKDKAKQLWRKAAQSGHAFAKEVMTSLGENV